MKEKCDRCGEYYDRDKNTVIGICTDLKRALIVALGCDEEANYDLCENCAESFRKWMEQDNGNT